MAAVHLIKALRLLHENTYSSTKTAKQKAPRLSVWKQNRSNAKNNNNLHLLAAVIYKNKRISAGNSGKVVQPLP